MFSDEARISCGVMATYAPQLDRLIWLRKHANSLSLKIALVALKQQRTEQNSAGFAGAVP